MSEKGADEIAALTLNRFSVTICRISLTYRSGIIVKRKASADCSSFSWFFWSTKRVVDNGGD
jgi:hypothetical protein